MSAVLSSRINIHFLIIAFPRCILSCDLPGASVRGTHIRRVSLAHAAMWAFACARCFMCRRRKAPNLRSLALIARSYKALVRFSSAKRADGHVLIARLFMHVHA